MVLKEFSLLFSLKNIFILCVKLVFVALQVGLSVFQTLDPEVVVVCLIKSYVFLTKHAFLLENMVISGKKCLDLMFYL